MKKIFKLLDKYIVIILLLGLLSLCYCESKYGTLVDKLYIKEWIIPDESNA